jgi:hypothetical protein
VQFTHWKKQERPISGSTVSSPEMQIPSYPASPKRGAVQGRRASPASESLCPRTCHSGRSQSRSSFICRSRFRRRSLSCVQSEAQGWGHANPHLPSAVSRDLSLSPRVCIWLLAACCGKGHSAAGGSGVQRPANHIEDLAHPGSPEMVS